MFFGSRGHTHAAELLGIILAVEQIPLFTALENFLFLGGDALAGFELGFFFFAERGGKDFDDLTANSIAVFDELDVIAGHQDVRELVRDAHNFFAAESHCFEDPRVRKVRARYGTQNCKLRQTSGQRSAQNQFAVARELRFYLFKHVLIRNVGAAHFILMLGQDLARLFVDAIFNGEFFGHALAEAEGHGFRGSGLNQFAFDELLDDFGGHVADVISVQEHARLILGK
jgi:hypothetical protein